MESPNTDISIPELVRKEIFRAILVATPRERECLLSRKPVFRAMVTALVEVQRSKGVR